MRKKKSNETRVLAGRQTPLCTCNHLRAVRLTKILQLTPLHQTTPPPLSFSSLLSLYVDRTLMFVQWKLTFFVLLTALPLSVCLFFLFIFFLFLFLQRGIVGPGSKADPDRTALATTKGCRALAWVQSAHMAEEPGTSRADGSTPLQPLTPTTHERSATKVSERVLPVRQSALVPVIPFCFHLSRPNLLFTSCFLLFFKGTCPRTIFDPCSRTN